jgi:DNA-binding NarL/FixJ family response regulator
MVVNNRNEGVPMGAKVSDAMLNARKLIEQGKSAYEAAAASGVTRGAISKSKWYQAFIESQAPAKSTQERARVLVVEQGLTAYEAAQKLGISQSTISRAKWYRDHIESLIDSFKPGGANA